MELKMEIEPVSEVVQAVWALFFACAFGAAWWWRRR
jgi:hypothetical protein